MWSSGGRGVRGGGGGALLLPDVRGGPDAEAASASRRCCRRRTRMPQRMDAASARILTRMQQMGW